MRGLRAPDMAALNSALEVKQFINTTKSKNKINLLLNSNPFLFSQNSSLPGFEPTTFVVTS